MEAFHVNHSAKREKEEGTKTQDISGPTSSEELRYADLPFFSLKMSQESSEQNLDKTGEQTSKVLQYCYISLESWNAETTHLRGESSQRARSEPLTKEKGCSFLLKQMNLSKMGLITSQSYLIDQKTTMENLDHSQESGPKNEGLNKNLGSRQGQSLWATPVVTMINHQNLVINKKGRRVTKSGWDRSLNLLDQVNLANTWATPRTSMPLMGGGNPETDKSWQSRLENQMLGHVQRTPTLEKKVLNPRWVETLMGLPIGWVSPNCTNPLLIDKMNLDYSEMELSQKQQKELSKSYGNKSTDGNKSINNWPTPTLPGFNLAGKELKDKDGNPWSGKGRAYLKGEHKTASLSTVVMFLEKHNSNAKGESWGTPTVMDSYAIERSLLATIKQATQGHRKGRTSSANLVEQVVYPITTEIYLLVKEYYEKGSKKDVVSYVLDLLNLD